MDFVDLTQAAAEALQTSTGEHIHPIQQHEAYDLRGKILGVLIRMKRLAADCTLEDCASFLRVEPQLLAAWEMGMSAPGLPQLELLALFLSGSTDDPREHALAKPPSGDNEYMVLRQRLVGGMLLAARKAANIGVEELSARTALDAELLQRYEFGEVAIPVNHMTVLAAAVNQDLSYFMLQTVDLPEPRPTAGNALSEQSTEVEADLNSFAASVEDDAFVRLALAFKHIDKDDLHRIADALIAISATKGKSSGSSRRLDSNL